MLTFPQIVPIYYGNWSDDDEQTVGSYLIGFKNWVSGAGDPDSTGAGFDQFNVGLEPVLRQYGVWGVNLYGSAFVAGSNEPLTEQSVVSSIHQWQSQGLLPTTSANTIFAVFANGFASYDWEVPNGTCAKHAVDATDGTLYAVVSFDGCTGGDIWQFERLVSHELEEAMTDPDMNLLSYGWVTHAGPGGVVASEGADQCETSPDSPHPFDNPFLFGIVQNFTDNTNPDVIAEPPYNVSMDGSAPGAICNSWALRRSAPFALTKRSNTQLDVVYQNFLNGSLEHSVFMQNYQWIGETVDPQPGTISGAPALVSPNPGQLDVFVRSLGDNNADISGGLVHWHKDPSMPFGPPDYLFDAADNSGQGPPTAVSFGPSRIDVFTGDTYAGIAHFWSNGGGFAVEHFQQPFAITPPVASSSGYDLLDVFTYDAGGNLQDLNFNGSKWSLLNFDITDVYFNYPADLISAAAWNGPSGVPGSSTQVYVSGLLLQFGPGRNIKTSFGRTENRGTAAIAASADGSEVIAVYYTDGDPRAGDIPGFYEVLRWSGNTASPAQKIVGSFSSPAQVVYGTDGYPEVIGEGWDGCLYETWLDYWSGGPVVNGPNATGICGLR